ncbi:hypothetical protein [Glycomyces sp. NRRL B-16210]|uniref:hypothetical protein n=1 Tax=Glycomyces sp. NRRL B-16210 TaxID=1463821 RepID=UPI00054D83AE|nr:hypothetical protein [Glycomyces sp. NRRL B-16210]
MDTEPKAWHNAYFTRVRDDGVREGLEEGLEKGLEKGSLIGQRQILLTVLEGFDIPVSARHRFTIERCDDPDQLEAWASKVGRVSSCEELFAGD